MSLAVQALYAIPGELLLGNDGSRPHVLAVSELILVAPGRPWLHAAAVLFCDALFVACFAPHMLLALQLDLCSYCSETHLVCMASCNINDRTHVSCIASSAVLHLTQTSAASAVPVGCFKPSFGFSSSMSCNLSCLHHQAYTVRP